MGYSSPQVRTPVPGYKLSLFFLNLHIVIAHSPILSEFKISFGAPLPQKKKKASHVDLKGKFFKESTNEEICKLLSGSELFPFHIQIVLCSCRFCNGVSQCQIVSEPLFRADLSSMSFRLSALTDNLLEAQESYLRPHWVRSKSLIPLQTPKLKRTKKKPLYFGIT